MPHGDGIERIVASGKLLDAIAAAAGLTDGIPRAILRHQPLGGPRGAKVVVVTRAPLDKVGGIVIPQMAQQRENDGWIVSASPDVGQVVGSVLGDTALNTDVLGLHVTWGRFVGTIMRVRDMDDPLDGRFLLMVEADLLSVIGRLTT